MTQRPWDRVPLDTVTLVLNPIVGCLAGGRNKSVAAKAYARLNHTLAQQQSGLQVRHGLPTAGRQGLLLLTDWPSQLACRAHGDDIDLPSHPSACLPSS